MISNESVFRHLPANLDRKQALYFDGIRHCAEIAELAYGRLKNTLTEISMSTKEHESNGSLFTSAFLDAWSLVDVIDRFRILWISIPNVRPEPPGPGEQSFERLAQPIRDLRNVADHIAQRADYIVAKQGTALGVLGWFTVLKDNPLEGVVCTIVPGTLQPGSWHVINPAGQKIEFPTGLVHLSAGEFTANLSEQFIQMKGRVEGLEGLLQTQLEIQTPGIGSAGTDVLIKMSVSFPGEISRDM
jgi:hypothetical protein